MLVKACFFVEAKGDVIAFIDCHCAPQANWYQETRSPTGRNYTSEHLQENRKFLIVSCLKMLEVESRQNISKHTQGVPATFCKPIFFKFGHPPSKEKILQLNEAYINIFVLSKH